MPEARGVWSPRTESRLRVLSAVHRDLISARKLRYYCRLYCYRTNMYIHVVYRSILLFCSGRVLIYFHGWTPTHWRDQQTHDLSDEALPHLLVVRGCPTARAKNVRAKSPVASRSQSYLVRDVLSSAPACWMRHLCYLACTVCTAYGNFLCKPGSILSPPPRTDVFWTRVSTFRGNFPAFLNFDLRRAQSKRKEDLLYEHDGAVEGQAP